MGRDRKSPAEFSEGSTFASLICLSGFEKMKLMELLKSALKLNVVLWTTSINTKSLKNNSSKSDN